MNDCTKKLGRLLRYVLFRFFNLCGIGNSYLNYLKKFTGLPEFYLTKELLPLLTTSESHHIKRVKVV